MRAVYQTTSWGVALSVLVGASLASPPRVGTSRERNDADAATTQLFQILNTSFGGKLQHYCLLADTYNDSGGQTFRHVLRVEYDKDRVFGRLNLYVRSVGSMTQDQLATYTPQQIYDFGESDQEKFVKTDTGSFGQKGDIFLQVEGDGPLHSAAVTDEARKQYADFVSQYVIPALQKGPTAQ
ncbi:MAG TPA: hypothetical protein VG860_12260 [Terriglobia bacterium]|jgi:hypothetical protein|nr:hypothetical protein [Terriglobia bacterium]